MNLKTIRALESELGISFETYQKMSEDEKEQFISNRKAENKRSRKVVDYAKMSTRNKKQVEKALQR